MKLLHKIEVLVVCTILGFLFLSATGRAEVVDRIVANVNGQIILYSDLQRQIALLKKRMPTLDMSDPEQMPKIERQVLEQIIQQKLADMEAKRLKITVSDSEIDARIKQLMSMNHLTPDQLKESLKANGDTLKKLREQIKESVARQQLVERVLKSQVVISDQEIDAYLKLQNTQGEQQEPPTSSANKVHLALIMLPMGGNHGTPAEARRTGEKLVRELQGGADFQTLAKQYSKGPTAQEGGDIGYMDRDDMAPFMAKAIEGLKPGQVSSPVQGTDGYYIVKLLDVGKEHTNIATSVSREKVRQMLFEQAMNRKYEQWIKDLESKAFIQISL